MGNASGSSARYASGCPLLRESDTLLLFCPVLQSEMVNSISRSSQEDLSQLCSETWCFFAVGRICVLSAPVCSGLRWGIFEFGL